jgi:hypothetical protein
MGLVRGSVLGVVVRSRMERLGGGLVRGGSEGRDEGGEGGRQVARVKASTSLRMKKRGNVPPRFDTLIEC